MENAFYKWLGAVLLQQGHLVAFLSHTFINKVQKKSNYERELMTIVIVVQTALFVLDLFDYPHQPTKFVVLSFDWSKSPGWRLIQMNIQIDEKGLWIWYKPGNDNKAVDALSKSTYATIYVVKFSELDECEKQVQSNNKMNVIMPNLIWDFPSHLRFSFQNKKLLYKGKLDFHISAVGGHFSFFKTYKRLAANLLLIMKFVMQNDVQ